MSDEASRRNSRARAAAGRGGAKTGNVKGPGASFRLNQNQSPVSERCRSPISARSSSGLLGSGPSSV